jgi:hypothetical protein
MLTPGSGEYSNKDAGKSYEDFLGGLVVSGRKCPNASNNELDQMHRKFTRVKLV